MGYVAATAIRGTIFVTLGVLAVACGSSNLSYVSKDAPLPASAASRAAEQECAQQVDAQTRNQARGHLVLLAQIGPMSWGPRRRWNAVEAQALRSVQTQTESCMAKKGWVQCSNATSRARIRRGWVCKRRPTAVASISAPAELNLVPKYRTVGVVALGPKQVTGRHWIDFEPPARQWLAQGPTYTTRKRGPRMTARESLTTGVELHLDFLRNAAHLSPNELLVSVMLTPASVALNTLVAAARPGEEYVVVQPLSEAVGAGDLLPRMPDKEQLAQAIRNRLQRADGEIRSGTVIVPISLADIDKPNPAYRVIDTILTLRVANIGLIHDEVGDPRLALAIGVWSQLDREALQPIEYKSKRWPLDAWATDDARLLRQEIDRAVESFADRILQGIVAG